MTGRDKALLYSPPIGGLLVCLGWFLLDRKGEHRQHVVDRAVRLLDRVRLT